MTTKRGWLRRRAEETAARSVRGHGPKSDSVLYAQAIADAIEAVAREFAERALDLYLYGDSGGRNLTAAEAIVAADEVEE